MSWVIQNTPSTNEEVCLSTSDYLFTKKAKISNTKDYNKGIYSSREKNTLISNNDITVKDSTEGNAYGVDGACTVTSESTDCSLTVRSADNASKLTVEEKMSCDSKTYAYGIRSAYKKGNAYYGTLFIGVKGESFKKTISVTASNNDNYAYAYATAEGICCQNDMTVNAKLAAPIKAKATSKNSTAESYAIFAGNQLVFNADIAADITAETSGKYGFSYGIYAYNGLTINGDVAGKITATGTTSNYNKVHGLCSGFGSVTVTGKITKTVTAKATSKESSAYAYGIFAKTSVTLGGIAADISATASGKYTDAYAVYSGDDIMVNGDVAGKITVTASGTEENPSTAIGFYSPNSGVTVKGKITKAITAKSTSKEATAYAHGIHANNTVTLGGIAADFTATASGKSGYACGIYNFKSNNSITVNGDVAGKITVTGTGTSDSGEAYGIRSENGKVEIIGKITKAITAKGTSKTSYANAYGILAWTSVTLGGIAADFTSTATGKTQTCAFSVRARQGSVAVNGDVAGKLTATATGTTDVAYAYGIYSGADSIAVSGTITKAITAKATTKESTATAAGLGLGTNGTTVTVGGISADLTATASGTSATAYGIQGQADTGSGTKEDPTVFAVGIKNAIAGKINATATASEEAATAAAIAVLGNGQINIAGGITKNFTATAESKGSGSAEAYGLQVKNSSQKVTLNDRITGTLTAKATSKSGKATAAAISTGYLSVKRDLGTVSVTATGAGTNDTAIGWDVKNDLTTSSKELVGKATVTCKTGTATGLSVIGTITTGTVAALDITATGRTAAYGINLTNAPTTITLKNSKITAKGADENYSIYSDDAGTKNITLDNSALTGDVEFSTSADLLTLKNNSTLTGDIDMGEGSDAVVIHSGSQVKGGITTDNTWSITLKVDDASAANKVLWEDSSSTSSVIEKVVIDVSKSIGETGKYALIKDAKSSGWEGKMFMLKLEGKEIATLDVETMPATTDHYTYGLKQSQDKKTLYLVTTVMKGDYTIDEAQTETVDLRKMEQDYLFTSKGKVTIKDASCGINDQRNTEEDAYTRTVILNNDISVTNKNLEESVYGIKSNVYYGTRETSPGDPVLDLRSSEKATKLTVTSDCGCAYGIEFYHRYYYNKQTVYIGTLQIGAEDESFKKSISVTSNVSDDSAKASGIHSSNDILFNAVLAASITAKATSKQNYADAYGIYARNELTFKAGIASDVTVTANGKTTVLAKAISSGDSSLSITGDVAGKITATATGNESYANAYALLSLNGAITVSGRITKTISAKATSKGDSAHAYAIKADEGLTLKNGVNADLTATADGKTYAYAYVLSGDTSIKITGDIAGKITASAASDNASAHAHAFQSESGYIAFYDRITKAVTAKSTSKSNEAYAYCINAKNSVTLKYGLDADITATANGSSLAKASGIQQTNSSDDNSITINGDIAGKITATATGDTGDAEAHAMYAKKSIAVAGRITKAMTVKATSKSARAIAYGVSADTTVTLGGIAADISATASGNDADAYAVYGYNGITVNGDVAGKITATASGESACATGLFTYYSDTTQLTITGQITKAIAVKATGTSGTAEAYGINSNGLNIGGIAADITATADAKGSTSTNYACGIIAGDDITINGDVAGNISATAKNTDKQSQGSEYNYDVYAFAINSGTEGYKNLTIHGNITKTLTANATTQLGKANAYGVIVDDLSIEKGLGTVNVTASGEGSSDVAYGWYVDGSLAATSRELTGKATVTCKTGSAYGLRVSSILDGDGATNVVATLDISVTGKNVYGVYFGGTTTVTLKDSKITAKTSEKTATGTIAALYSSASTQIITLDKSTLTGAVALAGGNDTLTMTNQSTVKGNVNMGSDADTLELTGKSTITGDVDMGDGTDTVKIHAGSQIKGEIDNTENLWLVLDDASAKSTALWEGAIVQDDFSSAVSLYLDLNLAVIGVGEYTLMKDTDGDSNWAGTSFNLWFDGSDSGDTLVYDAKGPKSYAASPYEYELKSKDGGKSLILAVTENT